MNRIKNRSGLMIALLLLCLSAACTYQHQFETSPQDLGARKNKDPDTVYGSQAYGSQEPGMAIHNNTTLKLEQEMSNEVQALDGVYAALVVMTDRNAYVAVVPDNTATGTGGNGRGFGTNNDAGTHLGLYDARTGSQYADPSQLVPESNSYMNFDAPEDLSSLLKQRVAYVIREAYPNVQQVHISANRQYINEINRLAQLAWQGQDLSPRLEDFNRMVSSHFTS